MKKYVICAGAGLNISGQSKNLLVMPHIVLEYSDNLPELPDFSALFNDIHQALNRIGGIKLDFYFKDPAGTLNYQ